MRDGGRERVRWRKREKVKDGGREREMEEVRESERWRK